MEALKGTLLEFIGWLQCGKHRVINLKEEGGKKSATTRNQYRGVQEGK